MSDRLEKFMKENKEAFDDLKPSEDLWKRIDKDMNQSPEAARMYSNWWKIAAVLFLCTTGWLLYDKISSGDEIASLEASEEFLQAQDYYMQQIADKKQMIILSNDSQNGLGEEFLLEIDKLDSMYLLLKDELVVNQGSEKIKDAMIVNLQLRIQILNQQLEILERLKTLENDEEITI